MATYDKGDLIRITGTFTDAAGDLVDPSVVIVKYKDPSSNITTLTYLTNVEVVRDSAGVYHVDVNADEEDNWHYRFESTGTGQAAGENIFKVRDSAF